MKGDELDFFFIIGYEQMGWKALFAPLIIVISILKMGSNFVHPLFYVAKFKQGEVL
jgi:hypothetical protein